MPFSSSHPKWFSSTGLLAFTDLSQCTPSIPSSCFSSPFFIPIPHVGRNNSRHQYVLEAILQLESSLAGKDLGVLVDTMLNISQQRALPTKRANGTLGFIRQSIDSRSRQVLPLSTTDTTPGVPCPVLSSTVRKTWTYWKEFNKGPQR